MDAKKQENLKELVERFVAAEEVQKYINDIKAGEQILQGNPAPEPDDMLIANIKAEIALHILPQKTSIFRKIVYTTAAAAVIIIAAVGLELFESQNRTEPTMQGFQAASSFPWDAGEDTTATYIKIKTEDIQRQVMAMDNVEEDIDSSRAVQRLEIESAVVGSDFWEG
jgi:hypothetical protein